MGAQTAEISGQPLLYSVKQAAIQLGISVSKINQLIGAGALRSVKIGRRRLIPGDALLDYVSTLPPSTIDGLA